MGGEGGVDGLGAQGFQVGGGAGMAGEQVGELDADEAVMVDQVGELDWVAEVGGIFEGLTHEQTDAGDTFLEVGGGGGTGSGLGGVGAPGEVFQFGGVDFAAVGQVLGNAVVVLQPGGGVGLGHLVLKAGDTGEAGNGV
jgi:hypothetical protein